MQYYFLLYAQIEGEPIDTLYQKFNGAFFLTQDDKKVWSLIKSLKNPANSELLNSITCHSCYGIETIHMLKITLKELSDCLVFHNLERMKMNYVYHEGILNEELFQGSKEAIISMFH